MLCPLATTNCGGLAVPPHPAPAAVPAAAAVTLSLDHLGSEIYKIGVCGGGCGCGGGGGCGCDGGDGGGGGSIAVT